LKLPNQRGRFASEVLTRSTPPAPNQLSPFQAIETHFDPHGQGPSFQYNPILAASRQQVARQKATGLKKRHYLLDDHVR
jgi:hypothetical protein